MAEGFDRYSPFARKMLFEGKRVNHMLEVVNPFKDTEEEEKFLLHNQNICFPGNTYKASLFLQRVSFRLAEAGQQAQFILKFSGNDQTESYIPANEHLTMQIAKQIYDIDAAASALVFFRDGEPAYITKRFDVLESGKKLALEDFATLAGKTGANAGNFKYDYSYEELGLLIQKNVPAWKVEIEKYFRIVLFNYIFSNGDAHLKNFSVIETEHGDFILSPAYDLINTRLHINDNDFGLKKGLFADGFMSDTFKKQGHASHKDFFEFAKRIGINESRINILINPFREQKSLVKDITKRSFLTEESKKSYIQLYHEKLNYLNAE